MPRKKTPTPDAPDPSSPGAPKRFRSRLVSMTGLDRARWLVRSIEESITLAPAYSRAPLLAQLRAALGELRLAERDQLPAAASPEEVLAEMLALIRDEKDGWPEEDVVAIRAACDERLGVPGEPLALVN